jgi:hypothetical protein
MQLFLCNTRPFGKTDRLSKFFDDDFVAIGYPEL